MTIRLFPSGRYEFATGGGVAERGRFSISSDGAAPDPEALPALRTVQFYPAAGGRPPTYSTVTAASTSALSLQRCAVSCEGVPVWEYRRR